MSETVREPTAASPPAVDVETAELAVQKQLGRLLSRIQEALGVDTVAVLLLDDSRENLVARAAKGLEEEVEQGVTIPLGKGFAGRVVAESRPIVIDDVDHADIVNPLLREKGIRSLMGVPLALEGLMLGVLHVGSLEPRVFTEEDVRRLELVAERVALPLAQSQLFELEQQARIVLDTARRQLEFLADAGAVLSSSLDYEGTLATVAELAVPRLADWCVIDLLEEDGTVRRVAVACADATKQPLAEELRRSYPAHPDRAEGTSKVLRTGMSELASVTEDWLDAIAPDERQREILAGLGLRSNILVPLIARGRTLGVLTLATAESGRIYREEDVRLAEQLAGRAALAVDNARLYREEKIAAERLSFLAEASAVLSSSLDYRATLQSIAQLAVPGYADWCIVDVVEAGQIQRVAVAASDEESQRLLEELQSRNSPTMDSPQPAAQALRAGKAVIFHEFTAETLAKTVKDADHLDLLRRLAPRSALAVPLVARGHTVGAITFAWASTGRLYEERDLPLAEELARRAALAVDNARLYREAEERSQAALALERVGDGVFLLDDVGVVRLWNPAAAAITGLDRDAVLGRAADDVLPGWRDIAARIPVAEDPSAAGKAKTVPLEIEDRELWLSISGVALEGGTVYAFRDLTEERALERIRSDFVSTVSHELRTPLASVYGASMTLTRKDVELDDDQRRQLLGVVAAESERLARIVEDVLLASRLDSETVVFTIESCDPVSALEAAVEAARTYLPSGLEIRKAAPSAPRVAADPEQLRQVLENLIDNAVKYSPGGGEIEVGVGQRGRWACFWVRDGGIGIPEGEQERIFEKFYRLDPDLLRGVRGTGLGLYISRELVRKMEGRIWVESEEGAGSTFFFELPLA
jgi:PAS domain S-box-containing protein